MAPTITTPLDRVLEEAGGWVPPRWPEFDPANRGSGFIFITPRMADAWLKYLNVDNRPPASLADIRSMAVQMARGLFICNGEPLICGHWGGITNGQGRLESAIMALAIDPTFTGFETLVVWGMPEEALLVQDRARPRRDGHSLAQRYYEDEGGKRRKYTDTFNLAATANFAAAVWQERLFEQKYQMPPLEVFPFVDTYWPGLYAALSASMAARAQVPMSKAAAAALYFLVTDADPALGREFWRRLVTGDHDIATDPVWVFREILHRAVLDVKQRTGARHRLSGIDQRVLLAQGVVAWGLFSTDTPAEQDGRGGVFLPWVPEYGVPKVNRDVTRVPDATGGLVAAT